MKVKLNSNNDDLWCAYWKERIEIGERYIEIVEDYYGEEIIKTYSYECRDMLIDEHLENYDEEPNIEFEDYE